MEILIMLSIVAIITLLAAFVVYRSRKQKIEPDYRMFFILGIIFMGSGVTQMTTNSGFTGMFSLGIIYMAIGAANKDKWGKTEKVSPVTQRWLMAVLAGTMALVILTALFVFM
jgi:hypothetical protein